MEDNSCLRSDCSLRFFKKTPPLLWQIIINGFIILLLIVYHIWYQGNTPLTWNLAVSFGAFVMLAIFLTRLHNVIGLLICTNGLSASKFKQTILAEVKDQKFVYVMLLFLMLLHCFGDCPQSDTFKKLNENSAILILVIFIIVSAKSYFDQTDNDCSLGSALAMSYSIGFLKPCVLPGVNDSFPSIKERMTHFQDCHGQSIKFRMKKLFILIPYSCNMDGKLTDYNLEDECLISLDSNSKLESNPVDRCGVIGRKYSNTVYKLLDSNHAKNYYCAAEVATPLQTLYEMLHDTRTNFGMDVKQLQKQREDFVNTLLQVVDVLNMAQYVEIIHFDDRPNGQQVKISDVLWRRIHSIENEYIPMTVMQ